MILQAVVIALLVGVQQLTCERFAEVKLEEQDVQCVQELNLTEEFVVEHFTEFKVLPEGKRELEDFVLCSWKKLAYVNEGNEIDAEAVKKWLEKDIIWKLKEDPDQEHLNGDFFVDPCKTFKGQSAGDTIIKVYNCIVNKIMEKP